MLARIVPISNHHFLWVFVSRLDGFKWTYNLAILSAFFGSKSSGRNNKNDNSKHVRFEHIIDGSGLNSTTYAVKLCLSFRYYKNHFITRWKMNATNEGFDRRCQPTLLTDRMCNVFLSTNMLHCHGMQSHQFHSYTHSWFHVRTVWANGGKDFMQCISYGNGAGEKRVTVCLSFRLCIRPN